MVCLNAESSVSTINGRNVFLLACQTKNLTSFFFSSHSPKPVELTVNDTLVIHLHNNLNEVTVIHAHGINQNNRTNHMDGAGMVTQWYSYSICLFFNLVY